MKEGPGLQMMHNLRQYLQPTKENNKILVCKIYPEHLYIYI